ncbi:hypothetical protein JXL21_07900 [Candidatus Bathyarchaeota archaeon]|nr:hypothetical protein [Candidatus Bathyarchaeota archaeon]
MIDAVQSLASTYLGKWIDEALIRDLIDTGVIEVGLQEEGLKVVLHMYREGYESLVDLLLDTCQQDIDTVNTYLEEYSTNILNDE